MVIPAEARIRFGRSIGPLVRFVESEQAVAEDVASAILLVWSKIQKYSWTPNRPSTNLQVLTSDERVIGFVDWLVTLEKFEEAAYWIATAYATLVGEETRTQRALYFTHPLLAERVIDDLVAQGASLLDDHWHDPACGGAAFLVPVALRMRSELHKAGYGPDEIINRINRNLSGNDTSQTLIHFSKAFLNLALAQELKETSAKIDIRITLRDGLSCWDEGERPTVVICNPPYRKLKSPEVAQYRTAFKASLQGQPNIYALFIEQALNLVRPGGLVGLLTPTSYLAGPLFSNLRRHLCEVSRICSIDLLGNRTATFLNVEQETVIATLRSGHVPGHQNVAVSVWKDTRFQPCATIRLNKDGGPWVLPRSIKDAELIRLTEHSPYRLKDYGYVPKVGSMVAYRCKRTTFKTAKSCKGRQVAPLIWATDITPQGEFIHGRPYRQRASELFIEIETRSDAGVFTQPAVLLQRLTSTDQSRRLVAAALPDSFLSEHSAFVCENHVIALIKEAQSDWEPAELAAMLKTNLLDRVYRSISGSSNVSVYELQQMPLPCPKKLREALSNGEEMEDAIRKSYD